MNPGPLLATALAVLAIGSCNAAPKAIPPSVLEGAEKSTKILVGQVLKGNYSYSIQKMYPRCKVRAAKRIGGEEKLIERLAKLPEEMRKNGISMLKYEVGKPSVAHEVTLKRGVDVKTGAEVQSKQEWLVFVPTKAEYKVTDPVTRQTKRIERHSFQVAIVKKGTNQWHFIDGSTLTINELRSFFPGLPENEELLGMPELGGRELD